MATLALKRKYQGYYQVENDTHLVTVEKVSSGGWQVIIEEKTGMAVDLFSEDKNLVQMTEVLYQYCTETKKQAVTVGTNWIIENL